MKTLSLLILLTALYSVACTQQTQHQNQTDDVDSPSFALRQEGTVYVKLCDTQNFIWLNKSSPHLYGASEVYRLYPGEKESADIEVEGVTEFLAGKTPVYNNYYRLRPGDSVCIRFVKKGRFFEPKLSVLNRPYSNYELNFFHYLNMGRLGINIYYQRSSHDKTLPSRLPPEKSYTLSQAFLDSLKRENLVSETYYPVLGELLRTQYYYTLGVLYKKEALPSIPEDYLKTEDLLQYKFYRGFLTGYVYRCLNAGIFKKPDHVPVYERIKNDYTGRVKDFMLLQCLELIKEQQPYERFVQYAARYVKDARDSPLVAYVSQNYLETAQMLVKGKTVLMDGEKKSMDFAQLLEKYRNKLLYIDLWASWCKPCRAAMPASKKLRKAYAGRDVAFVYISLDEKLSAWENAVKDERLNFYPHSYLLLNPQEAPLLKNWKVQAIPRYLLYDREGKLLYTEAPSPESEKLKGLLDKYLFE